MGDKLYFWVRASLTCIIGCAKSLSTHDCRKDTAAIETALQYGLYDLHRLEHLILERVAGDFFHIDPDDEGPEF